MFAFLLFVFLSDEKKASAFFSVDRKREIKYIAIERVGDRINFWKWNK